MAEQLKGMTIALAGPRKAEEMAAIVSNMGGTALHRPAQGTVFLDEEALRAGLTEWTKNPPAWAVLTTGMGLDALVRAAEELGLKERFLDVLSSSKLAARGYKTVNALKKLGFVPQVRDDDGSTTGLLRGLQAFDLRGQTAVVQLHGEPAPRLLAGLAEAGAAVREIQPYRHTPPAPGALAGLLGDILEGRVDAVAFTSAPQFRFLAEYARAEGRLTELVETLEQRVLAVSVGKITSEALREEGISRIVMPEHERMGSMFVELGKYVAAQRGSREA
ncbi:uroporphyrinogen-III synthase [Paenibacillus sp. NFR01]|uniref:uroporphyrinogen-III synthase n=1 Tax=Paenibacillus sp. NFR01 TaxID=1566279 RepID=UPI0008BC759B|nr:uroporphyrinogen-III synthase [Paenibacillus sp. NFR01]SEU12676.1 uroporphyrinogen-III synthase [Paenibacillus sp. NFR01]